MRKLLFISESVPTIMITLFRNVCFNEIYHYTLNRNMNLFANLHQIFL